MFCLLGIATEVSPSPTLHHLEKVLKAPVNILDRVFNSIPRKKSFKTSNFKPRYKNYGYRKGYVAPTSPSYFYKPVAVKTAAPVAKSSMKSNSYSAPSPVVANVGVPKPISTAAPFVKLVESSVTTLNKNSGLDSNAFDSLDMNSISQFIEDPYLVLEKLQPLLEDLNEALPKVIANMDPTIKSDIKEVNLLVLDICDRAIADKRVPTNKSDNSQNSFSSVCAFLHKHLPDVSRGLDDPAIITDLVEKVTNLSKFSKQVDDLFD